MSGPAVEWGGWDAPGMVGAIFQHATDALLLVDPLSERVLDANDRACGLCELSREELLGASLRSLLRHEQEWQDWPPLHEKSFVAKEGFLLQAGKEERWTAVAVRIHRLPLPGAGLIALVALSDRRDQIELARRLQRAEAELRYLLAAASDCLWGARLDASGRWYYRYLSPAVQRLTGRPTSAFLDDPLAWEAAVHPDDLPAWRQFRERLRAGRSGTVEYRLRGVGGDPLWVHEAVVVFPDEGGLLLSGVLTDISERKRKWSEHAAVARSRLDCVADLAGTLAHDLNNLLTGILGHVSLARLGEAVSPALDEIEKITLRAADLCLSLGVVAGKARSTLPTRDVAKAVGAAVERAMPGPKRPRLELGEELPEVQIDEAHLCQIVEALLRNAAEAIDPVLGEVVVRAGVGVPPSLEEAPSFSFGPSEVAGSVVWLEVRDNGPGIAAELLPRLGEPFLKGRPSHRGLGLAQVVGLLRGHRGGLQIYTAKGQGTLARVLLPAVVAPEPARPTATGERRHGTVLVADDEATVREVATRLLQSAGCDVVNAASGEEALALLRERHVEVQLLLIDLTMPGLSGDLLLRELRKAAPDLPLVLMSGYPEADILPRFADVGLAGYLQKPFRLPALQELLSRLLPAGEPRPR